MWFNEYLGISICIIAIVKIKYKNQRVVGIVNYNSWQLQRRLL